MYVYGPHFTLRYVCVLIGSSLLLEMRMYVYGPHFTMYVHVLCEMCIWSSLYLEICVCAYMCVSSLLLEMYMYVYGPHFTLRCVCMYMVLTLP